MATVKNDARIDAAALAEKLGISISTVHRWNKNGKMPSSICTNRSRGAVWDIDEVARWEAAGVLGGGDPADRIIRSLSILVRGGALTADEAVGAVRTARRRMICDAIRNEVEGVRRIVLRALETGDVRGVRTLGASSAEFYLNLLAATGTMLARAKTELKAPEAGK